MIRLFILLICVSSFCGTAFGEDDNAKALQLLDLSMQCQLAPVVVSNEDDGFLSTTDLIKKKSVSNASVLRIDGQTERHIFNGNVSRTVVTPRNFSYAAQFKDLSSADSRDSSVVLTCSGNKNCIEHVVRAQECTQPIIENEGGCNGPVLSTTRRLHTMELRFCDSGTTAHAKVALDVLIGGAAQVNNAAPTSVTKSRKAAREHPDEDGLIQRTTIDTVLSPAK